MIYEYVIFWVNSGSGCVDGAGKCCKNFPSVGKCIPKVDDNPENDGKCWLYCINDCERGGFCKLVGKTHVCHCYCWSYKYFKCDNFIQLNM